MRAVPLLLLALFPATARAGFPGNRFHESLVFGANVVVLLGPVTGGHSRLGAGVDGWYQVQWYTERSATIDGQFTAWAQEHPAWNYGPAVHAWWAAGVWHCSMDARFGVAWPLRVGLWRGWWPGPALTVEVGGALSTAGYVALDTEVAADVPWAQARLGAALGTRGIVDRRVQIGVFVPLQQPQNWPTGTGIVWEPPK